MKRLIPAGLLLAITAAHAAEGMWMPQQLPQIAKQLKAAGLKLDPARLNQLTEFPMGAVVSLGGCTASFVSPQGLVVTNHHCAYGSIQYNSTAQRDLLKNGFLAADFKDELPAAPGSRIFVTEEVKDVTAQVLDAKTAALSGKARVDAIEAKEKALVAACELDKAYRCRVAAFYGGLQYQLIKQMQIRDVRLVHAPADMVGRFGGDTDNWIWPRHTGDYSFYRAYVGPDGKPADFSADNKPYQPKHHLKLASTPLNEGDFVMVTGYPGRTQRHRLPQEVDFAFSFAQPTAIKNMGMQLDLIKQETSGRREAEIAMAGTVAGLGNGFKNLQGQMASYADSDILERKRRAFDELKAWVNADAARRAQYGTDLAAVESLLAERQALARQESSLRVYAPRLLGTARGLYQFAQQQALPDAQRKPGFQERDALRLRQGLESQDRRYDAQTDIRLASHFYAQYLAQPAEQLSQPVLKALGLKAGMDEAAVKARLQQLQAASQLTDKATRLGWMQRSVADFAASQDAYIAAAVALYEEDERIELRDKELGGRIDQAYANTMAALMAFKASKGEALYPDANGTLRVSFGQVQGRKPGSDGNEWKAFTTLRGITAKHTGTGDFDAPEVQRKTIAARQFDKYAVKSLDSVPVNFLATLDTTGGNSGSPVLNSRAELVGLLFDGTLDAVISNWDFNPKMTRSINVDVRYMLWQMKVVDKADRVLKELNAL